MTSAALEEDRRWAAVAEPTRRRVLDLLLAGGEATATSLARELPLTRQAMAKHLVVLERAGLVESRREGRELRFAVRPERLDAAAQSLAEPVTAVLRVEKVERPHYFSFRWMHPDGAEPDADNSVLVEFSLNPEGENTRLRLVESGFRKLARSEEETKRNVDDHSEGWDNHLGRLREYLSRERAQPARG